MRTRGATTIGLINVAPGLGAGVEDSATRGVTDGVIVFGADIAGSGEGVTLTEMNCVSIGGDVELNPPSRIQPNRPIVTMSANRTRHATELPLEAICVHHSL
jgi:hypothetical protein